MASRRRKGSANLGQVGTGPTLLAALAGQGNALCSVCSGALKSSSFTPPTVGTAEYLFRPEGGGGHIVSMYSGGNRLYYGLNDGSPGAAVGFGNGAWPTPRAEYLTSSTTPDYQMGHWYYVGVVYDKATLQGIQVDSGIGSGFDVYEVTSDWDELTVTGATAPTVGANLGLMSVNSINTLGGFSAFSSPALVDLVQAWYLGQTGNFGLNLKTHVSTHGDTLASRENTVGYLPPQLVLEYAIPEPSTCVLMGLGSLALVLIARRRKRAT